MWLPVTKHHAGIRKLVLPVLSYHLPTAMFCLSHIDFQSRPPFHLALEGLLFPIKAAIHFSPTSASETAQRTSRLISPRLRLSLICA